MFDVFYIGTKPNLFPHERQVESVEQAQQQSRTRFFWLVSYLVDYTGFDFLYEPPPWQCHQRHAWPSQYQHDSGTYLVPTMGYTDTNYHSAPILPRTLATAIYEIDHMDGAAGQIPGVVRCIRYFDNYRDTLIRLAKSIGTEHEFVWVCSSICDYSDFDFAWHPNHWQYKLLHVFASDDQKFGDTFFMHVPSFAAKAETVELLDWYDCNFVDSDLCVPRRTMPVIKHNEDSHVDAVLTQDFLGPLAVFSTSNTITQKHRLPAVCLWRPQTKTIVPLNPGAGSVIVPKSAIPYIKTQLYDYPYIDNTHCETNTELMDVIFISYDEPDAEQNWNILTQRCARAKRVHGVTGMETALEVAAELSSTPWYYAVFAKTRLHEQFDFSYVPDRMQQPKHYIFDCINTVNGLQYGHMGVVMYNCQGIRELNKFKNFGLDYTLSFAHESVPVISCYGDFNQTAYHTWRTAFRECAKLAYFESQSPTVDGEYRLNTWLSRAQGNHAEWCLKGARDGVEFFKTSDKSLDTLKQSFRWQWLREYFVSRYGDLQ